MFRFTIRDVLWLTALVALGAACWVERERARMTIEANGQLKTENVAMRELIEMDYESASLDTDGRWTTVRRRESAEPNP